MKRQTALRNAKPIQDVVKYATKRWLVRLVLSTKGKVRKRLWPWAVNVQDEAGKATAQGQAVCLIHEPLLTERADQTSLVLKACI